VFVLFFQLWEWIAQKEKIQGGLDPQDFDDTNRFLGRLRDITGLGLGI
jgi:hypothetical protein